MEDDAIWKPSCLTISSGNISIDALLGCLFALEKKGLLEKINSYASSGNGCFLSVLLCLGYSMEKIKRLLPEQSTGIFLDAQSYQYLAVSTQPRGEIPSEASTSQFLDLGFFFSQILEAEYSLVPTFNQLYLNTGKKLFLTTYNVTLGKAVYLSKDSHPDMSLATAIKLTTGVCHMTCDISYNGDLYIDGGCSNPLPTSCFGRNQKILAIRSRWNRDLEKIYPKTEYGYSRLLFDVASEKLASAAFRWCLGKSLFVTIAIGSDNLTALENKEFLQKTEKVIIVGYDQGVAAWKHMKRSTQTNNVWNG